MHEREDDLRWAPLLPGAVLATLLALLDSCDAHAGIAVRGVVFVTTLESPWLLVSAAIAPSSRLPSWLASIAIVAIVGVSLRVLLPRRWTSPVGLVAGLAWALCSCAVVAAKI